MFYIPTLTTPAAVQAGPPSPFSAVALLRRAVCAASSALCGDCGALCRCCLPRQGADGRPPHPVRVKPPTSSQSPRLGACGLVASAQRQSTLRPPATGNGPQLWGDKRQSLRLIRPWSDAVAPLEHRLVRLSPPHGPPLVPQARRRPSYLARSALRGAGRRARLANLRR